jgi:hypothetical protein
MIKVAVLHFVSAFALCGLSAATEQDLAKCFIAPRQMRASGRASLWSTCGPA